MAYASSIRPGSFRFGGPAEIGGFIVGGQHSPGDLAAEHESDDGAGHVLVDAGQGDGLNIEAGLFADLAAQPIMDALAQFQDAAGRFPAWLSRRQMSRARPWSSATTPATLTEWRGDWLSKMITPV